MRAPISIVIPTLDAAESLPETVAPLIDAVTEGAVRDLVISDGGSEDQTSAIAERLGATIVTGPKGRGGQIARGIEAAGAPWLLILHADTQLSPDWLPAVEAHMAHHPSMAGWFRLRFRARGVAPRIVETGANLRARFLGLPYGDQALFVHRDTLTEVGGMPTLPLMEDVALARRLKGRLRPLDAEASTSADRYLAEGWTVRTVRNLANLTRYLFGAEPETLAARYDAGMNAK